MTDPDRSTSRWSSTTRSTTTTHQTIPLVDVRRKLLRQSNVAQKNSAQLHQHKKPNVEELFKLYYSNDVQFDSFQRQIVTGKRIQTGKIPSTIVTENPPNDNSSDPKVSVPPERLIPSEINNRQQSSAKSDVGRIKSSKYRRSTPMTPLKAPPVVPQPSAPTLSVQADDFDEPSLVKSVSFFDDTLTESHENLDETKRPTSSKSSIFSAALDAPHPSFLLNNSKSSHLASNTTSSTLKPIPHSARSATKMSRTSVTSSQQRLSVRKPLAHQRAKSNTTIISNSTKPMTVTARSSGVNSPLSFHSDATDFSGFPDTPRVVSIPSKCSRYVLVSFPEVPLRYNTPSYIERLLLPERFPKLFQNIVRSYDQRSTK